MAHIRTASLLRSALMAALISAAAPVVVPIGPVPVTLQVLVVALAALVLTPAEALGALALYIGLGAAGAPVFAGGGAGVGVLLGPTGGFIVGFAVAAPAGALVRRAVAGAASPRGASRTAMGDVAALAVLLCVTYLAGWMWFAVSTGRAAGAAFAIAVAPFILIDIGKSVVALIVARAVRAAGLGAH